MDTVSDYLQYFLKFLASEISPRKALGIFAVVVCFLLLRWMWRQSVREFKKGLHSHDEPQREVNSSHRQQTAPVKSNWGAQFVRVCRASGLAMGEMTRQWKAGKRPSAPSSRRFCPKCGRTYESAGSNFCETDGTKLMNSDK